MLVDVSTHIEIARPRQKVAEFAADPDNVPLWYQNIKSVEWKTPAAVAVGSRIAFVAHFLGKRMQYTYEIVEFIPGYRLVMQTAEGPFPMQTIYTWNTIAEGTKMTLQNRGVPTGFSVLVAPFLQFAMRRANRKDLAQLKRLLESAPAETL